jgi:hypothetical protein
MGNILFKREKNILRENTKELKYPSKKLMDENQNDNHLEEEKQGQEEKENLERILELKKQSNIFIDTDKDILYKP